MKTNININRLNYETYVIDYLDGKLNAVENACFIVFLENNNDIKDEINNIDDVKLIPDDDIFIGKSKLKKIPVTFVDEINEDNYEDFFIASSEGDLSVEQSNSLTRFLGVNTGLVTEYNIYGKLKIQPVDISFPDKNLLKHKPNIMLVRYLSVAATLLLLLASWFFINRQIPTHNRDIAIIHIVSPRSPLPLLSSNIINNIDNKKHQTIVISEPVNLKFASNSVVAEGHRKVVLIAPILNRTLDIELVNPYDFAKLVNRNEINNSSTNDEMAMDNIKHKKINSRLLAKVFKAQILKLKHAIKINRTNHQKLTDPTYIKVLDKSLMVFNTITGSQTPTVKTYNGDGELTGYQIEGRELLLNRHDGSNLTQ